MEGGSLSKLAHAVNASIQFSQCLLSKKLSQASADAMLHSQESRMPGTGQR